MNAEVARSSVVCVEPPAPQWTGRPQPAIFDLHNVSMERGRVVFHGLDVASQRALREQMTTYTHFVRNAVVRDRFDDVFDFSSEPLRWSDCARVETRSTFILSPWHIDNAFHLHCDNLVAMYANLRQAGVLSEPRCLYLYEGDAQRNAQAVQLWAIMDALFDGAVRPLRALQDEAGPIGFRHIRWGGGPKVFYLRDGAAPGFGDAAVDYQRWVLQHYGIEARTTPTNDAAPRVLIMSRTGPRRIVNDDLLADACRDLGCRVQIFGDYARTSARDLVALVHEADILAGVHGAALAHLAYLPTGSLVAELRVAPHPLVFEHMAAHFRHRHAGIDVDGELTADGMVITPATAKAIAQRMLAEWADRRRRRAITIRTLGTGKWGNEVFWYMFGKTYARRHGLELQVAPWVGNALISAVDPPVKRALPDVHEKTTHGINDTVLPNSPPHGDVNLTGYFQYHTSYYASDREYIRAVFQPAPDIAAQIAPAWQRLRQRGGTAVAIHLRRGDYGFAYFYRTPVRWYLEQLQQIWPTLDRPFLYIASDAPDEVVEHFAEYEPVTSADLGPPLPAHDFYRDFYVLQHSDVLLIPNSTFSFAASMLNANLQRAYRSHLPSRGFVPFDPWNSKPLDQDRASQVERYPWLAELWRPMPARQRWAIWARRHARDAVRGVQWVYQRGYRWAYLGIMQRMSTSLAQWRFRRDAARRRR